ncbi:MAG: hypothetical protein WAU54_09655 [Chania sp.]
MDVIDRIWNWLTFTWSAGLTSVGLMTQKEWLAAAGIMIGLTAAAFGEIHRRRVMRTQETTNVLLEQLVDAVRSDTENRQEVRELISSLKGGSR